MQQSRPNDMYPSHPSNQDQASSSLPKKKGRSTGFWAASIVAIVAIAACAILAIVMLLPSEEPKSSRDPNQALGQLEGKSPEEIQAELDRIIEEGMLNISIAGTIEFEDGQAEGEANIENVPGNRYLMQVAITRDDTGEAIYTSGVIDPNHNIKHIKLDKDLDPGTYECTATFSGLDKDTEEKVGQAAAKVTVIVYN